jgi:hypothetical protein
MPLEKVWLSGEFAAMSGGFRADLRNLCAPGAGAGMQGMRACSDWCDNAAQLSLEPRRLRPMRAAAPRDHE